MGTTGRRSGIRSMGLVAFDRTRRAGKRFLLALGVAGALSFSPIVASADGLTAINLDCGDGHPYNAIVDLQRLTEIQEAVQAMIDFPADMSCTLSTSVVLDPFAVVTTQDGDVVGGGRYIGPAQDPNQGFCFYNFAISGHAENGEFHGTSNVVETTQAADGGVCTSNGGHLKATVSCVTLDSTLTTAGVSGPVQQANGDFTFANGFGLYTHLTAGSAKSTPPGAISHEFRFNPNPPCPVASGGHPLMNGSIHMHD